MDLCGPMRVASINGKRYVLVIVDDYSRYTWTHFLRSKDEIPKVLINFLRLVQRGLHAQVRIVRTDKGMEFLNQTLHAYFDAEGINHQTSVARTPEQNGVVERENRTLIQAARTMLSAAKVPLFFWAEAIATTCFTQIILSDGENLDKMKEKGDACIFVRYSTQSRAYKVFNKRTRVIVETIHVNFEEMPKMASDHVSSDPIPECPTTALEHDSLSLNPQLQDNVTQADRIVVSKSSAVTTIDAPNQRLQQHTTPLNNPTTLDPTCQVPTQAPIVTSNENIHQAEMIAENAQVENDEFINIFCTPIQDRGETLSCHVDSSNMHTFYQHHPSEHRWTKDHPLEQVIGNPSQSVRTRRQLELDGEMCMFALTVSQKEPKNIKEAMADSAWIASMQEELHQFDRLDGYAQKEGIDFEESFALVARLEAVWLFIVKFEMSMMGELKFFLGIQINQSPRGIFINQAKYAQEILLKHGMTSCDSVGTPIATKHLDVDLSGTPVDRTKYRSMVGALMYLPVRGDKLVSWSSKKQDCISMSSAEVEIPMYCDSKAAIAISCNPVQHSRTKH
nr:hypothetical protein [Tanacetum cinerariifolium]